MQKSWEKSIWMILLCVLPLPTAVPWYVFKCWLS
jgi:hypothetical protein